jgi:aromatic-L-amino-acid decarboxylase
MRVTDHRREYDPARLELTREDMRRLGRAVIDAIIEINSSLPEDPVVTWADRATTERRLREPAPSAPSDPLRVLDRVLEDVLRDGHRNSHPRYFGYVPNPNNFVGAMADALVAGLNTFAGMWAGSPGAAQVELLVTDWLREWCGLPESGGGILLSGSSMANLVGLATARHAHFGADADRARTGTIYFSDQAHSSVAKGARIIGIAPDRQRRLSSDDQYRFSLASLARAVDADRRVGLSPFCVIAAAGTTNTGAIDPLPELADFCRIQGIWLHVDGAFGAAAVLTAEGRQLLAGIERADSIALDAHKWLFQPIECGCLLVRDMSFLRAAFHERPEYLRDVDTPQAEINYCDYGPQLTRVFRALKLWMSIQVFGLHAFRAAISRGMAMARLAEAELRASGAWEIVTPEQLSVLTFRHAPTGIPAGQTNEINRRIAHAILEDGYAAVSTTELSGQLVLRMCVTNPRVAEEEIRESVRRFTTLASAVTRKSVAASS